MPLPSQYAQIRIVVEDLHQREFEIITWWLPTGAPTLGQADADALVLAVDTAVSLPFKNVLPSSCQFLGSGVRLNTGGVTFVGRSIINQGLGSNMDDPLPPQNAVVIRKTAGVPGRASLGRWFIPCVPEGFATEDILTIASVVKYDGLRGALTNPVTANGNMWNPAHRSRKNDTILPILGSTVEFYVFSQDKRAFRPLL